MEQKRKLAAVLAVMLTAGSVLAGCGSEEAAKAPAGGAAGGDGKPVKLDIIETGSGLPSPDQDIIKSELDKALKTEINLTVYASMDDYKNQLNVRMASSNYPDLFLVDKQQLKQFSEQGLLLDLTPYKEKLKPTLDFIGEESVKKAVLGGKQFAIAKSPQVPYDTYWVRKDWLDKLGLKVPATPEELLEVSKAFKEKDPDGNGKADTFGLTGGKLGAFSTLFGAYGVGFEGGAPSVYVKDGKMVHALYDGNIKAALGFIREFVASGSVDPELLANSGLQHRQKAIKGEAGIIYVDWPNMTKEQFVEQMKAVSANVNWVQVGALKGPGGAYASGWDTGKTAGLYAIPRALEKNPEKLQKVFDLLNYVSTKEGSLLVQYGVKGKHYNLEGEKVVPTELMGKEGGYFWLYQFTGRPELEYLKVKFEKQAPYVEFASKQPRIEAYNGFINYPAGYNAADADRYIEEELAKFIYGKRPLEEYDAFLKTLEGSMNYKAYLAEAEKRLKELGYLK
ncbi:extracellular solute-binding protein [Paenibacillus caseinilyticus]|uniref:ABC transporter substrate-binding protein n=1 Tax=Paenibacillus mucilaginosus K02 TaxID=997761 RepID=I0BC89_9BACL|nr:extracellular solute-binding protein [Paenibacillus mucilaginosus]AFH59986.1 ABC transporter substrate-binding protein [Paenibacillus mucilaginosus K02]